MNGRRWRVRRCEGRWWIFDPNGLDTPFDVFDSLTEAHTAATQNAVAEVLFAPGGLTWLARYRTAYELIDAARQRNAYELVNGR